MRQKQEKKLADAAAAGESGGSGAGASGGSGAGASGGTPK